jgi:hypothetical protein
VRCTDPRLTALALAALLAGCGHRQPPAPVTGATVPSAARPAPTPPPGPVPAPVRAPDGTLPPPERAVDWAHFRHLAALRMVAASPERVYDGPVPDPLPAIPVLEIELTHDGRVQRVQVLRQPTQARDTIQLAIDAVYRAAPYGPVAHLPPPWKFAEVFLFDDDRRFKPRTLDLD